jgi:redox-sensitive bicupin YhaK (pirin superfamily)
VTESPILLDAIHARISPRNEVLRFLPHRERRLVGAWCFIDVYGPENITGTEGMAVAPHPHMGLQTVSWLVQGRVLHRDSIGSTAHVEPGRVAIMTAGRGIAHSENSAEDSPSMLQGAQLWVALPSSDRDTTPAFELYDTAPVGRFDDLLAQVFVGHLGETHSEPMTFTPILGAELTGGRGTPPLDPAYEHLIVALDGDATVGGMPVGTEKAVYFPPGSASLTVEPAPDARLLLVGGRPFGEEIVMWWNLIGRSHEEIEEARAQWEAHDSRFGEVTHYPTPDRFEAPALPHVRLKPRGAVR